MPRSSCASTSTCRWASKGNNLTNSTQKLLVGPYKYTLAADSNTPAYNVGYTDWRLYQNAWFTFDRRFALTARVTF